MALQGVRVVEFAGLAPGPFAGLILADWGANVIRVDLDVKNPAGLDVLHQLIRQADVLIDPFRPGVMERLNLGPDVFLGDGGSNRKLVYARLAGYPIIGPQKNDAGHDINYLALSGVLSMLPGEQEKPSFPLNLLADFGGGGLMCALGILLALIERQTSGLGQVVNTDMVSGTRYLSTYPLLAATRPPSGGLFPVSTFPASPPASSRMPNTRLSNTLDGGAPFYNVYTCADGRWMSVGCLEPQFYKAFLDRFLAALPSSFSAADSFSPSLEKQFDARTWPQLREFFRRGFRVFERDHWAKVFEGSDACAMPVLSPAEAAVLARNYSRVADAEDGVAPMPHPLLSRTPARDPQTLDHGGSSLPAGQHNNEVLRELGISADDIARLARNGAFGRLREAKL